MRQTKIKRLCCGSLLVIVVSSQTACVGLVGERWRTDPDQGSILISADAAGMQSFGDFVTGAIETGKNSPDIDDSPYWRLRREQNQRKILRFRAPSKNKGVK